MICGADNGVEHYGKRIKSFTGVHLRADLSGHSYPICLGRIKMLCPIVGFFVNFGSEIEIGNQQVEGKIGFEKNMKFQV